MREHPRSTSLQRCLWVADPPSAAEQSSGGGLAGLDIRRASHPVSGPRQASPTAPHRRERRGRSDEVRGTQPPRSGRPVPDLATTNNELTARRQELVSQLGRVERRLDENRAALADLDDQFTRTRERVAALGQTGAVGLLLQRNRAGLPDDIGRYREERRAILYACSFTVASPFC